MRIVFIFAANIKALTVRNSYLLHPCLWNLHFHFKRKHDVGAYSCPLKIFSFTPRFVIWKKNENYYLYHLLICKLSTSNTVVSKFKVLFLHCTCWRCNNDRFLKYCAALIWSIKRVRVDLWQREKFANLYVLDEHLIQKKTGGRNKKREKEISKHWGKLQASHLLA